jgi:hypothetical protein
LGLSLQLLEHCKLRLSWIRQHRNHVVFHEEYFVKVTNKNQM